MGEDETPWQITADSLTYKNNEQIYVAKGGVVITKNGQALYAREAIYNIKTGIARVTGDVRLVAEKDILRGEEGYFDLKKQTGRITKGSLFLGRNHYYIDSEVMEKAGDDTYLIKNCQLTTCDGDKPAWAITGSEVKITVEGYGTVKNAAFRVHGIPVLYSPYMIFPARTKRQTGLLPPGAGWSSRNGLELEVPFFWAISDQADASFYQRFMTKRGYMQGLEFRYVAGENSKGVFLFDILSDREEKDMNDPDDVDISPYSRTNRTRYWLRARADQDLPLGISARLDMDFVSDQDYLREFRGGLFGFEARPEFVEESGRPLEEKKSPTRRSALRLIRDSENYSLQALTSYHQRPEDPSDDDTAQPLAGLNFISLPEQVAGFPMFFDLEWDYDYVWRDTGQKGHRASISPELKFPLWIGRYFEFEPSLRYTYNAQFFDDLYGDSDNQSKKAYEAGARLSTNVEKIYVLNRQNVKGLKHRILPVLTYNYRVQQDDEADSPWFEPIDEEGDANLFSFALENYFDVRLENKKGDVSYRQWATLVISQGYNVATARQNETPGEKKETFEPLSARATLKPSRNIDFYGMTKWDHYDQEITFTDVSLELSVDRSGNRKDIYELDYRYELGSGESIDFLVDINLAYGFSVGSSLERELAFEENISSGCWLEYESQCWGIKLGAENEHDDVNITLGFRLFGLGDIKAW